MNFEILKNLSEAHAPSGNEGEVRQIIKKEIKPYVDEMYVDKFGNLIARKKGSGTSIMLAAHMDEIGLMVRSIDKEGKVFVAAIGGVEPVTFLGERVKIVTSTKKEIFGVVTTREIQNSIELTSLPAIGDVYIDVGGDKNYCEKEGVRIGDYAYVMKSFWELGDQLDMISGKALDDRIGCYILVELAKRLRKSKADIYYVFTVQEEIGLYGAETSVYSIDPDYAIVVDVTEADDGDVESTKKCVCKGPVIVMKDAEMITTKCINDWLFAIAKKLKISLQPDVGGFGTTDALNMSVSKGGLPLGVVGVAVRNIHTATSIASKKDITDLINILEVLMKNPPKICL
ncbi:MAG: M42 family peptidase [Nanoarchaeota archaeon]|nr:M42 family peptidase [Nanoarchaeota archaeon]